MKYYFVTINSTDLFNLSSAIQFYAFDQFQGKFVIDSTNLIFNPVAGEYVFTMTVKATV
jgi:hypothetical protein